MKKIFHAIVSSFSRAEKETPTGRHATPQQRVQRLAPAAPRNSDPGTIAETYKQRGDNDIQLCEERY